MRSTSISPEARLLPLSEVRHGADWGRWGKLTAEAPPFLAPEFFALSAPLADGAVGGEPLLAEAWVGDTLIGALPLRREGRKLHALRSAHTPEFDYRGAPEGLDAIWEALRRDRSWTELVLETVPAGSLLATRLPELARKSGCMVALRPGARHRYFALPGFEGRLDGHFRANLKRCARKAGGIELERFPTPTRAAFDEALALEAMAWKAAAGTSIDADHDVEHLYRTMSRLFGKRGRASVYFLRAGGERIAMLVAVEDKRTLWALKIGYDPRHAAIGPGHLILWKVAADAEARGLRELNLVGRDDEWKRKWTAAIHEHVALVIYRRSPRGLLLYAARELVKPWLPDVHAPLRHGCQRTDHVGTHTLAQRVRGRLRLGFGVRSGIKRRLRGQHSVPATPGAGSRFPVGSWVRVLDEPALRATLDERSRLRGLLFAPSQRATCGHVYRVTRHVRRIRDDRGVLRRVSRTVLLEGVTCNGAGPEPAGCGRHCPMWFRDEWLEAAEAPHRGPPASAGRRHVHVKDLDEIVAGLDLHGRRDGLTFMPEMAAYAGRRFAIAAEIATVYEFDRWTPARHPLYILEGLSCSGQSAGAEASCDRACAMLWHEDWLRFEP